MVSKLIGLSFLEEEDIVLDMTPSDKMDAIYNLVRRMAIKDKGYVFKVVSDREKLKSTALGEGIAFPHARTDIKNIDKLFLKIAILKKGVDFDAVDKAPVNFIFLIVAPVNYTTKYLSVISHLAKLMSDKNIKEQLIQLTDRKEILDVLKSGRIKARV